VRLNWRSREHPPEGSNSSTSHSAARKRRRLWGLRATFHSIELSPRPFFNCLTLALTASKLIVRLLLTVFLRLARQRLALCDRYFVGPPSALC